MARTRQALAGRSTEFATKTRTSRRCFELDVDTEHVLECWRDRQRSDGHRIGTRDSMFTNTGGEPLHRIRSACWSRLAFRSKSCQNDSAMRTRRSRFKPTNTCCPGMSAEAAHRFADLIKPVDDGHSQSTAKPQLTGHPSGEQPR